MTSKEKYTTPKKFETLFGIFSSSRFLKKEGLGGELPHFIHSYPVSKEAEIQSNIHHLVQRLHNTGIEVLLIDVYCLSIEILKRENLLEQIFGQEKNLPKQRLLRVLSGPLNIDTAILPEIQDRLGASTAKIIFITGIGAVFPVLRSHSILNNIQSLVRDLPLVMFFPGTYNNQSLTLFDRLKDDNFYRAHNLNDYRI